MRLFQDQFLIGVTGIIFNQKGEVLLFKHTYRQMVWSLPGGYLKAKEHPQEALEREILEESGLIVSVDEPVKTRTDRESARLDLCYLGMYISGEFSPSSEVSECGFYSRESLPEISENQLFLIDSAVEQRKTIGKEEAKGEEQELQNKPLISRIRSLFPN